MLKLLLLCNAVCFVIVCSFLGLSAQQIYLATGDPLNEQIEELQARGYLEDLSQTEKPWLMSHIIDAILADELEFDSDSKVVAENILNHLQSPQRHDTELLSAGAEWGLGVRGLSRERREGYFYQRDTFVSRDFKNELGSIYSARLWTSKESKWGFDSKLIFDSDGTRYPWYYGTAHNARIIGQFDHAYLTFQSDRLNLLFGRQRLIWGPSPRGSLLLNDTSPPIDMLGYSFSVGSFTLSGFSSRLDDYTDPLSGEVNRRYLSGHRIRLNPGKGLEIALSEIYLYGGADRLPELYYNIPIVLYYWEAQNRKLDDNAFWGLDISWVKSGLGRIYSSWVFDDIQRQSRGPQKFAMQFGANLAPQNLRNWTGLFEFNLVDTYVYGQRKRLNAYLNYGWPIGRLDSDQREYFAGIYRQLSNNIKLGVEYVGRDKGEYDAADIQPNMAPFGIDFPSGVVEHLNNFAIILKIQAQHRIDGHISLGYETIENYQHISGYSIDQAFAMITLSYSFTTGIPFWKESP